MSEYDCFIHTTPHRIKGRAIFRSRPSTNNNFLSPVQFFPGIFPMFFSKKHQKIVARPFSPVLSCSKIGRPSCFSPVLLYGRGCSNFPEEEIRNMTPPQFKSGSFIIEPGFGKTVLPSQKKDQHLYYGVLPVTKNRSWFNIWLFERIWHSKFRHFLEGIIFFSFD